MSTNTAIEQAFEGAYEAGRSSAFAIIANGKPVLARNGKNLMKIPGRVGALSIGLFSALLFLSVPSVQAKQQEWFYVNMDRSAVQPDTCIALSKGESPEQSLTANVGLGSKLDYMVKTEDGDVKVFVTKSGTKYAYAPTSKACAIFREDMFAASEQRKLAATWLVADAAKNLCRPLTDLFPAVGNVPGATTPAAAKYAAFLAGMRPEMVFLSPRFASLTVTYPDHEKHVYSIFAKHSECTIYVSGAHAVYRDKHANTVTPNTAVTTTTSTDREVRGFGNDPGWQWKDTDVRRHAISWRSINLAALGECTSMDESSVKTYERGFKGQVAHIRVDGKPTVLMVRDNVHIYLMPVTLNECVQFAKRLGDK